MKGNVSMIWRPDFPRLNDCVVTKQTFCIVLLRLFSIKFRCFVSTVCFSKEDNCCQLQGIGKLIKDFFYKSSAFWSFFFSKIMLESWGCGLYMSAAYTRVFTVFQFSILYFNTELKIDHAEW